MSKLKQPLRCVVVILSCLAVAAAAGGACAGAETHHGIVGCHFTVSPSCVVAGETTNGEALARPAVDHGDLVGHASIARDGVARRARNNRKGDLPAAAEGDAAESSPYDRHHGDGVVLARYGDEKPSARINCTVVMSPTSSMRETSAEGALPRGGRGGGDHPFNTIGDSWRTYTPADDGVASVPFGPVDALHLDHLHIPEKESFNYFQFPMLHNITTTALSKLINSSLHYNRTVQPSTRNTVLIALMIVTVRFGHRPDQKKKTRRRGTRAAAAVTETTTLILVLLSVAVLPNGAAAARPLHGGGVHVQVAAPPAVVSKSFASSGRSSCTNDPNTMGAGPCVHH